MPARSRPHPRRHLWARPARFPARMRTARHRLWCHVPGASHRLLGGCFLWLSPPPPPEGRGKPGGSGLEKARFWFGSAARYATCPLPGVWTLGAAGEIEAAWVGPGRAEPGSGRAATGLRQRSISFSRAPSLPHPTPADASLLTAVRNMTLGVTYACMFIPGNLAALLIPAPDAGSCLVS